MPIAIGTSPNLVTANDNPVTSSFNAPEGSLLVAGVIGSFEGTIILSGGGLTWTEQVLEPDMYSAALYTAPCPAGATGLQITGGGGALVYGLKIWVVTGQHETDYIGNTGQGSSSTNNVTVNGYTSSGVGSRGFCVASENNQLGSPTSTDAFQAMNTADASGLMLTKATATPAAGTTAQFNLDASGSSSASWRWCALEILAAPDAIRGRPMAALAAVYRASSW
ncbi:hypothetical protein ACFQ08_03180 [Streptosporangium algeriense]|uniref:Uncharacterized protein n=1 Tax=Streptosporangium algeriense TaxID=1682748 RepID=A0ABW3DI29_9ACTN